MYESLHSRDDCSSVKTEPKCDRRSQSRFPQNLRVLITQLPQVGARPRRRSSIAGRIQNMSQGGLCVITPYALTESSVLRCEIAIAEAPIKISTLVQVRWTEKQKLHPDEFLSGLSFLL
jgi:hypothetical protein